MKPKPLSLTSRLIVPFVVAAIDLELYTDPARPCEIYRTASAAVHDSASLSARGLSPREVSVLKGFRQFVLRGNVLDLAVAVVIGGAFAAVVTALVKDLLTPLIAALVGKPDFSAINFTVNGSQFLIGDFINALIAFLLMAAAVYFFVVAPVNAMVERRRRGEPPADPTTK